MQKWHPDMKLLFSTGDVVSHGSGLLHSFRAGFQEATGLFYRGGNSPSSGLVAIQIASQMCSSVDIYGFALGNCLGGCPRYHYWRGTDGPERGSASSYKGHQYDVEGWLLKVDVLQCFLCCFIFVQVDGIYSVMFKCRWLGCVLTFASAANPYRRYTLWASCA
jgi:hypothetical protein